MGRTARGENGVGRALLFLREEELGYLQVLRDADVPLKEFEFSWNTIADVQSKIRKLLKQNYHLSNSAKVVAYIFA